MHDVLVKIRFIFYRFHDKGLEFFLVKENDQWTLPSGHAKDQTQRFFNREGEMIELEADEIDRMKNLAIEADWHDMPSIRGLIKHDLKMVEEKFLQLEEGSYLAAKEAFKKVLPQEYALLKELKDILFDRNLTQNI
ncbi:MAG TPA: hypothetical protein PKM27_09830 [Saprospiraceae bacterium]|nr:hypothetical protein [Saprospiraceae bacterium]HNT18778.1 hypothetical protein [Saprospiraceae bacterium]